MTLDNDAWQWRLTMTLDDDDCRRRKKKLGQETKMKEWMFMNDWGNSLWVFSLFPYLTISFLSFSFFSFRPSLPLLHSSFPSSLPSSSSLLPSLTSSFPFASSSLSFSFLPERAARWVEFGVEKGVEEFEEAWEEGGRGPEEEELMFGSRSWWGRDVRVKLRSMRGEWWNEWWNEWWSE